MRVGINSKTLAVAVASLFVLGQCAEAATDFRTIALSGQQAPGASLGELYDLSDATALMNDSGNVAVYSRLSGTSLDAWGLWKGPVDNLGIVLRTGMQAPGMPAGTEFKSVSKWRFDEGNDIALIGLLQGSGGSAVTNDQGLWSDQTGSLQLIAAKGSQADGTGAGVSFQFFTYLAQNDSGRVVFNAQLAGPGVNNVFGGNNEGIWSEDSTGVGRLVVRQTDPGPLGGFRGLETVAGLNDSGSFVTRMILSGDIGSSIGSVWQSDNGGALKLVASHGQAAPGQMPGVTFDSTNGESFSGVHINNLGHIGFEAGLMGPGLPQVNNDSLWSDRNGNGLQLVLKSGQTFVDVPNAALSYMFPQQFNNANRFAAIMDLKSTIDSHDIYGLFVETDPATFRLAAQLGGVAPGTGSGVTFSGVPRPGDPTNGLNWIDSNAFFFNDDNQVAFFRAHRGTSGELRQ